MSDATIQECTPKQAREQIERFRVIDVRFDFEVVGPLGAIHGVERIDRADFGTRADALRDEPLLLVCRSGGRSGAACRELQALGIEDVTNLVGGMIAWNEAGLPVERPRPGDHAALLESVVSWFGMLSQTPRDAAPTALGLGGEPITSEVISDALDSARARLEATAPPDLEHSLATYRDDLQKLDEAATQEA